jgi:exodeoxyribonuclease VII large subunit
LQHEFKSFTQGKLRILERTTRALSVTLREITIDNNDQLARKRQQAENLIRRVLSDNRHFLNLSHQEAMLTDPRNILARGYSITTYNGRALKDANLINQMDTIETRLYNGQLTSKVTSIKKEN